MLLWRAVHAEQRQPALVGYACIGYEATAKGQTWALPISFVLCEGRLGALRLVLTTRIRFLEGRAASVASLSALRSTGGEASAAVVVQAVPNAPLIMRPDRHEGPTSEFLSSPSADQTVLAICAQPLWRPAWVRVRGDHRTGPEFRPRGVLMGGEGAGAWWRDDGMTRKPTWRARGAGRRDDNPRSITCSLPPYPPDTRIDPQSAAADAEAGHGQPWTARPR